MTGVLTALHPAGAPFAWNGDAFLWRLLSDPKGPDRRQAAVVVRVAEHEIPDGSPFDFGETPLLTPVTRTFTVSNQGTAELILDPDITVPEGFTVVSSFDVTHLAPGASTTFTVQLTATATGRFHSMLQVRSNDPDRSPFALTLSGEVVAAGPVRIIDDGDARTTLVGLPASSRQETAPQPSNGKSIPEAVRETPQAKLSPALPAPPLIPPTRMHPVPSLQATSKHPVPSLQATSKQPSASVPHGSSPRMGPPVKTAVMPMGWISPQVLDTALKDLGHPVGSDNLVSLASQVFPDRRRRK